MIIFVVYAVGWFIASVAFFKHMNEEDEPEEGSEVVMVLFLCMGAALFWPLALPMFAVWKVATKGDTKGEA